MSDVQAKRWEDNVGVKALRTFVGSLSAHKAHKGVFITTSELMNAPAFTLRAA